MQDEFCKILRSTTRRVPKTEGYMSHDRIAAHPRPAFSLPMVNPMTRHLRKLILIFFTLSANMHAQGNVSFNWTHSWGGSGADSGSAVATDSSGNVYVVGSTSSFGAGGYDVLLTKYDSSGSLVWAKTWGGSSDEYATGVLAASDGFIYIVGGTASFGAGWYDALILKFDSNGNFIWARTWGGGSFEIGHDLSFDRNGNLLIAAETYSFGTATVLLKFGTDGSFLGSHTWKGPSTYDGAYSITVDGNGNTILTGISWDYSVFPNHNTILVLKYDNQGNFLWNRTWAGPSEDGAWGTKVVRTDAQGNIYIVGNTSISCTNPDFSLCDFDVLLLKIDPNGNFVWARKWGGIGRDTANSFWIDASNNLVVAGSTTSFFSGRQAALIQKYDGNGNILASKVLATSASSELNSIVASSSGAYVATGDAPNNGGSWQDTGISAVPASGSLSSPPYSVGAPTGTTGTPSGSTGDPTSLGVADTGGGGSDVLTASFSFAAAHAPPVITSLSLSATSISENDSVNLSGSFTDPDIGDSHTVAINWGDGSPVTTISLASGLFSFAAPHQYLNNPIGTASGIDTIMVIVTDSGGATGSRGTSITVNNVPPVVGVPVVGPLPAACPFGARTVTAHFSDVGTRDTHSCTIAWGDVTPDTPTPGVVSETGGSGSCAASHVYSKPGSYPITVTVTDDDRASAGATARVEVGYTIDFLNECLVKANCFELETYQEIKAVDTWAFLNSRAVLLHPVTVGIIDTGVNTTHQEFTGVNFGTTPAAMRTDSGSVDEASGEFLTHGTNVAGIMGANNISAAGASIWRPGHMNGILSGVAGLPYTLEMRPRPVPRLPDRLQAFEYPWLVSQLITSVNDLAAASAKVVNVSWALSLNLPQSACYRLEGLLIQALSTHSDTLFVVGAGNDNLDAGCTIPANLGAVLDNVLTVGGSKGDGRWTDTNGTSVFGSNFGAAVNIAAPAIIWSPGYHVPPQLPNEYNLFEGTSGAAPQVAAVAAVIKSIRPALTPRQMKCVLVKTGDVLHADMPIGPRMNALAATQAVLDPVVLTALACPP